MEERKLHTADILGWGCAGLCFCAGLIFYIAIPGYRFSGLVCFGVGSLFAIFRLLAVLSKHRSQLAKALRLCFVTGLCLGLLAAGVTGAYIGKGSQGSADTECEYVIILGAGLHGSVPSLTLRNRLDAAYEYLQAHPKTICIVSGGQGPGEDISEAECMFRDLAGKGIDPVRIWQENKSTSTRENIVFSLNLIEEKTGTRPTQAGILSSEYHLYRAGLFAQEQGLTAVGIPAKTSWATLRVNYFLREILAVWYYAILGG